MPVQPLLLAKWAGLAGRGRCVPDRLMDEDNPAGILNKSMTKIATKCRSANITVSGYGMPDYQVKNLEPVAVITDIQVVSSLIGALFGLTPKKYQSGEKDVTGGITRTGDEMVRTALYEAANVLLSRITRFSKLKRWGMDVARLGSQDRDNPAPDVD
jgi:hypothetical protein